MNAAYMRGWTSVVGLAWLLTGLSWGMTTDASAEAPEDPRRYDGVTEVEPDEGGRGPSVEADETDEPPPGPGSEPMGLADPGSPTQAEGPPALAEDEDHPVGTDVPVPRHSVVYKNLFGLRYNPLGLVDEFQIGYRLQLFDRQSPLFRDTFLAVKAYTFTSPAFARLGPMVEFQPLAILNLSATYMYVGYFSTFDQLQSFPTPTADFSDSTLEELGDAGENYPTWGHRVRLSALLQAKVWNIAIRDNVQFFYSNMKLREGDTVYYNQTLDLLEPNDGWVVNNDLDLIYLFDFGLKLGARYTVAHAFYQERHFLPGEPVSQPNGPTQRIGPAILHTFYDRPDRRFNKPTLILLSQWWLRNRYRTGADVNAGVPYLVLAFLFEGQLWPNPKLGLRR